MIGVVEMRLIKDEKSSLVFPEGYTIARREREDKGRWNVSQGFRNSW